MKLSWHLKVSWLYQSTCMVNVVYNWLYKNTKSNMYKMTLVSGKVLDTFSAFTFFPDKTLY